MTEYITYTNIYNIDKSDNYFAPYKLLRKYVIEYKLFWIMYFSKIYWKEIFEWEYKDVCILRKKLEKWLN